MKIAIFSDIHDNVWKLHEALDWITTPANAIQALIICGDLCSPFIITRIQQRFPHPIHLVFGNNDGDTFRLTSLADPQVVIHGELAELSYFEGELRSGIDEDPDRQGLRIAVNHYHHIAEGLIQSGRYNIVCYGHNHKHRIAYYDRASRKYVDHPSGDTILSINPGPIMGFDPAPVREGEHDIPATFVVLDLETLETETLEV